MKCFLLILLFALPSFAQKYDKFKDQTTATYAAGHLQQRKGRGLIKLYVMYTHKGEKFVEPDYWILFMGDCRGLCFRNGMPLIFLTDERIELIAGRHDYDANARYLNEKLTFPVTKDELIKIGSASAFQLGEFEVELTDKQRKGIREFVK